jgi:ABC-2 type transport system permease protein
VAGTCIAAAVVIAAVLAVIAVMTLIAGAAVGAHPSALVLGRGMANVWPLAMLFAGVAALACGRLHRAAPVTALATGTLVAMYVIDLVGKLADPVALLRRVSAFRYYGSAVRDGIDPLAFAGVALLAAAGALLLERRDVR